MKRGQSINNASYIRMHSRSGSPECIPLCREHVPRPRIPALAGRFGITGIPMDRFARRPFFFRREFYRDLAGCIYLHKAARSKVAR